MKNSGHGRKAKNRIKAFKGKNELENLPQMNNEERMAFVEYWAKYVREHDDLDWSIQKNMLINSSLKSASMTREQFLRMKGEMR